MAMRRVSPAEWDRLWTETPDALSKMLTPLLTQANCTGTQATVFYQSPTLISSLFSCPAQVRDVTSAARMALADMASLDLSINPWSVQPLARDRRGEPRRRHIAIAADTEQCVSKLVRALCDAGLSGVQLVPMQAALTARTVDHALDASSDGRAIVSVHFGQTRSVIIAAHDQRVLLARQVDFGTDRLVQALANSLEAVRSSDTATVTAETLLHQHGLPTPGQVIELDGHSFGAAEILPAIQPVLQRILVEIRQSIRFGLADIEAEPLVFISGCGASIPRLAEAFTAELQSECVSDQTVDAEDNNDLSHAYDACRNGLRIRLQPREEVAAGSVRSLRNALYAGSAAALVLGAGQTAMMMEQTESLRPQVDALEAQAAPVSAPSFDPRESASRVRAVRSTIEAIDTTVGSGVDLSALLQELCLIASESAILTDIEFSGGRSAQCRVRGYASLGADGSGSAVRQFIDRLRDSPMIESVRLEGTQTSILDDRETQYFTANLSLRSVPYPILNTPATIASVPTESNR